MSNSCPCGSGGAYADCCAIFHAGTALPDTPEQLMRSRYSAFVKRVDAYLIDTWHPGTRPDEVATDDTAWLGLEIIDAPTAGDKRGVVEFIAHYREHNATKRLHERSRFVKQSGRWWYLDGTIS